MAVLQSIAICVFAPLVGAAAIASERERGTWTRLLSSPAPRAWIATGKLLSAWAYVLVICAVGIPRHRTLRRLRVLTSGRASPDVGTWTP